ncbi:MAG: hypothetical protein QXI71_04685 [Candidatus Bathyarchaeia archaeon]|nr:hypothetical protein [Candidatus Bathyarchaeota archaeon]
MSLKFSAKPNLVIITTFLLLSCNFLILLSLSNVHESYGQEKYTYYGYVPAKIYNYNLTDNDDLNSGWRLDTGSVAEAALVAITATKDDTHIWVYCLDNGSLVSEAIIDSMQTHYVVFRNDTFFKVETSKLANVLLLNYEEVPLDAKSVTAYPLPFTFHQDVNGAYVGKEFVFMAVQFNIYLQYTVFALEDSKVTVTREDNNVQTFSLKANGYKRLIWEPFTVYKVESTGNIMIHSGNIDGTTFFVPSAEGGFVGRNFYSLSNTNWDATESYGYRISATQDTTVTVWSLETKEKILTANVKANSGLGFKPKAPAIFVHSNQPITLECIHNGSIMRSASGIYGAYGSGIGFFGVRPNEDTPFFLPVESYVEAYVFAFEDTEITVDDNVYSIEADSHYVITTPGTHIIRANKKVIVETLNWPYTPEYQGLQYSGTAIPCIQTTDVIPEVKLTPIEEAGFPIMYIIIGAAAAAAGVIALLLIRSRRKE